VTALHKAAYKGFDEVIETLIAAGADVNARRDDGITPTVLAESERHSDTLRLLIKHGGIQEKPKMVNQQQMGAGGIPASTRKLDPAKLEL